jgi:hypothetical protein
MEQEVVEGAEVRALVEETSEAARGSSCRAALAESVRATPR